MQSNVSGCRHRTRRRNRHCDRCRSRARWSVDRNRSRNWSGNLVFLCPKVEDRSGAESNAEGLGRVNPRFSKIARSGAPTVLVLFDFGFELGAKS
jgi:hypothetical protein